MNGPNDIDLIAYVMGVLPAPEAAAIERLAAEDRSLVRRLPCCAAWPAPGSRNPGSDKQRPGSANSHAGKSTLAVRHCSGCRTIDAR